MDVQALALAHRLSLPVSIWFMPDFFRVFYQFLRESNAVQISHIHGPFTGAAMSDRHHIER